MKKMRIVKKEKTQKVNETPMRIPNEKKCLELLRKYNVPEHIIAHSILVAKVADFIAEKLNDKGEDKGISVNAGIVHAAALLHDIDKIITLNKGTHSIEGFKILKTEGYEEVGKIVLKHVLRESEDICPTTWEEKIVFYADERVKHNKITSVEERFDDIMKRYNNYRENIILTHKFTKKIEKEIFNIIQMKPGDVGQHIRADAENRTTKLVV